MMTDDERPGDVAAAARALPGGSLIVLRARDTAKRATLARSLIGIARAQGLLLVIASDPELAARVGADGAHFPEARIAEAARWRTKRPDWLVTAAAHSLRACARARAANANAVFLAAIFPTASHPGRPAIGLFRALAIARLSPLPVYALGGIDLCTARRLRGGRFAGIAAVGALGVSR